MEAHTGSPFLFFILFSVLISAVVTVLLRKKKYTHIEKEEKTKKKQREKESARQRSSWKYTVTSRSFFLSYLLSAAFSNCWTSEEWRSLPFVKNFEKEAEPFYSLSLKKKQQRIKRHAVPLFLSLSLPPRTCYSQFFFRWSFSFFFLGGGETISGLQSIISRKSHQQLDGWSWFAEQQQKQQSPTYKKKREGGGRKQLDIYIAPNFVRKAVTV